MDLKTVDGITTRLYCQKGLVIHGHLATWIQSPEVRETEFLLTKVGGAQPAPAEG